MNFWGCTLCLIHCVRMLFHKAFPPCPPQHLQTTYLWWRKTLRPLSVDTKPRISLLSALQREGNRPHRWVAAEDVPSCLLTGDLPLHHTHPCCLQRNRNCLACYFVFQCTDQYYLYMFPTESCCYLLNNNNVNLEGMSLQSFTSSAAAFITGWCVSPPPSFGYSV